MNSKPTRAAALMLASLTFFGCLMTTALAGPPKKGAKKPPAKKKVVGKGNVASVIAEGKKVYTANGCNNCHVISGQGGKSGPELTTIGAETSHSTQWLIQHIENPREGSGMPPYKGKIKQADMTALVAYLASLKK